MMKTTDASADSAPSAVSAPAASGTGAAGPEFSTTNVQEAGIDEPDVVKTDGQHVYVVAGQQLRVIDVTGDAPRQVGSLTLGGGAAHQLLIRGTRALVLSTVSAPIAIDVAPAPGTAKAAIAPMPGRSTVLLTEVDLTDPAAPKVARTMTLNGDYVDARMVDGTVRVVVSSTPMTTGDVSLTGAPLRTFVPATTIRSQISHRTFRRGVVPCDDVRRPDGFSGLGLLTVLTVNLDKGLYNVDRDAVMAGAQTVYGSGKSLYVASQRYVRGLDDASDVPGTLRTEIHRFDASTAGQTTYAGSGTVPGFVVNAYALSEQDGALRVASTDEPAWLPEGGQATPAHSYVTVLSPRPDGALAQVGQVGGLGEGQRIFGVRFAGTTGYVVTFRQTDPLYTIDLSKPEAPRVVGELEIPGYSAYLHPLGDGLLLGIGQEADDHRPHPGHPGLALRRLRPRPPQAHPARRLRQRQLRRRVRPARLPLVGADADRRPAAADLRADRCRELRRRHRPEGHRRRHRRAWPSRPRQRRRRRVNRPLAGHRRPPLHALVAGAAGKPARHPGARRVRGLSHATESAVNVSRTRPTAHQPRRMDAGQVGTPRCMAPEPARWKVPATAEQIAVLRTEVTEYAQRVGVADGRLGDIRLAVSEAVTNAVLHAYRDRDPVRSGSTRV